MAKLNLKTSSVQELGELDALNANWYEPGKSLIVGRNNDGLTNIWSYDLESKEYRQLTFGPGPDTQPIPDPADKGFYYVNGKLSGSLSRYNVKTNSTSDVLSDVASQPAVSFDGKKVMYLRLVEPRKTEELWVSDIDGNNKTKIITANRLATAMWSRDNQRITFMDFSSGGSRAYIVGADGKDLHQIAAIPGNLQVIVWGADGKSLYATAYTTTTPIIYRLDEKGEHPEKLTEGLTVLDATPDGKYLLGIRLYGQETGIYAVSLSDRKRLLLAPDVATFVIRMAPDGKSFLYPIEENGKITFYRQGFADGKAVGDKVAALKLPFSFPIMYFGNAYDFAPDLSTIIYARPGGQADFYFQQTQQ
jgi:WD40 repeat protein